jgi:hypothetical protein
VIKLQTVDANRRVATDDGLAIVIGTNTPVPVGKLKILFFRFAMDNYSQVPSETPSGNSNTNK